MKKESNPPPNFKKPPPPPAPPRPMRSSLSELLDLQPQNIDGEKLAIYSACSELLQMDQSFKDFGDSFTGDEFSDYHKAWQDKINYLLKITKAVCGEPIKKEDMTCFTCKDSAECASAWDLYNTSGECLAGK